MRSAYWVLSYFLPCIKMFVHSFMSEETFTFFSFLFSVLQWYLSSALVCYKRLTFCRIITGVTLVLWICFSNTRTIGPSLRKSPYQIGCTYLRVHLSLTFSLIAVQKLPCLSIAGLWNFYCLLTCTYGGLNTCMIISLNLCWILGGGRQAGGTIVLFSMMFPKIIFFSPFFAFICISNLYASGCYFF